jgi:hypothetical protein
MFLVIGVCAITILTAAGIIFEFRLRKPDQMVLFEKDNTIKFHTGKFYKRHFNLAVSKTAYPFNISVEASAKGNIDVKIRLSVSVAASLKNINQLIKTGGWNQNLHIKAAKELEITLISIIKEFTEKSGIEELSSEKISGYLAQNSERASEIFGLEIVSLSVQSVEAADRQISDAMKQRESARILEQTELLNQKARISSMKAKLNADEEIAVLEHELKLKIYDLKNEELVKENILATSRTEEEVKREKMRLELDKEEMELLKNNPELLMLTPQAARLAEASQSLKNARTIVTLSPADIQHGTDLLGAFQNFIQNNSARISEKKDTGK